MTIDHPQNIKIALTDKQESVVLKFLHLEESESNKRRLVLMKRERELWRARR